MNGLSNKYVFFLGGADAEMSVIRNILDKYHFPYFDKRLGWGARASAYKDEIARLTEQEIPVLIELANNDGLDLQQEPLEVINLPKRAIVIDHHNERSGEEASIIQVLKLLDIEPEFYHRLVAANDTGYIPAMLKLGAHEVDILAIRATERREQAITAEQEDEAVRAIENRELLGNVFVIRMSHSKCAPVTDRMFFIQPDQNILIISSDGEVNYFGDKAICEQLHAKFTKGWSGGSGEKGYFGANISGDKVLAFIKEILPRGVANTEIIDSAAREKEHER